MIQREREFSYKPDDIYLNDILRLAFRSVGLKQHEFVKRAGKVIWGEMIMKNKTSLPLREFVNSSGYDYDDPKSRKYFWDYFFLPLYNLGLIERVYGDVQDKESGVTQKEEVEIRLDNKFGKVMNNFKLRWAHLTNQEPEPKG